jgi:cytochrome c
MARDAMSPRGWCRKVAKNRSRRVLCRNLMKHIPLVASVALVIAAQAEPPQDFRFKVEKLLEGVPQPMEIELAPDGRIFLNEYNGALKIYHPDTKQLVTAGKLEVFTGQENGFLGFALDPKFAENGWIYCLYSPPKFFGQSLSRFTMKGDVLDLASEKVLHKYEEQRKECCHHAGSVEFGPDGNLYWSAGDNTHPHGDSGGYAPIDERPDKAPWDAQKSASNTNSLAGKICRIRPKADGTYEIPAGNLFPPEENVSAEWLKAEQQRLQIEIGLLAKQPNLTPPEADELEDLKDALAQLSGVEPRKGKTRPEIYAMGCRNPWRMSIDPKTGFVYWGEVGPDAGGDGPRGPRGYDEINQARRAGNFGWPYFIGDNFAYNDFDYARKEVGKLFSVRAPKNDSPNNTGLRFLPPPTPALIYWPYREPKKWPELGEGGRTACAGPVFYWEPEFEKTNGFPRDFDRCLLFWDWERPFIKWARLDEQSNLAGIEPFTNAVVTANKADQIEKAKGALAEGATLMKRPVDALFGKDGCLYIMDYGETWGANKDSQLLKISYVRGNLPPIGKAAAKPMDGSEPLKVELSAAGSKDLEGDPIRYQWRLQPGGKMLGEGATISTTIAEPGNYIAEVEVTDGKGGSAKASVPLTVGNSAPTVTFESPQDGDFFSPEKKVAYRVAVTDAEDGRSSAKPEEFGARTLVSTGFLRADGKDEALDPGMSLMKQSDCFNCHAVEQKVIGPALMDIAAKYRGQAGAVEASAKRVREGSTNVWGPIPMLPHPQHTTDEVAIMLRWVFGLEKGKGGPVLQRGIAGEVTAPKADRSGLFILEATYTDAGRGIVAPLSGKARVALRSRRIEVESGEVRGPKVMSAGEASGKRVIGSIDHGHFVVFRGLNLSDTRKVKARATSGGSGGRIEFRAGSPGGDLLASVEVPVTGGWDKWREFEAALNKPAGRGDVCVVFANPGKGGLMNVDWVEFAP